MISLAVVFVLGVLAQQTFADDPDAIVGGTAASPGQFPHQGSLRYNGQHICGCSIIGENKILTAAHCVHGILDNSNRGMGKIVVGSMNIYSTQGQTYDIKSIHPHPNYNPNTITNDVAVIILTRPIQFSSQVKKIALASNAPKSNTVCQLSGWGLTRANGNPSPNLLYMHQATMDQNSCANRLSSVPGTQVTSGNVCALNSVGIGACQGDSGGPFICDGVQHGITSWGIPCARGLPDVYTSVSYFKSWIERTG